MRLAPFLCLILLLTGTPALAQEPPPPSDAGGPPPDAGMPHPFDKQRFEARIAELAGKLQLTAAQKPLWDAYVAVLTGNHEAMAAHFKAWHQQQQPIDVPARLDQHLAMLNAEIDGLQQEKQALGPLWSALGPEQRDILNKATAWHPHPHGDHHQGWGPPPQ